MAAGADDSGGIQVIARAAAILRVLEGYPDGLGFAELTIAVNLPRSTVQRIVAALAAEQLLLVGVPKGRVRLGPALIGLASATDVNTDRLVRPVLQALSRELGETVDLSVLQGDSAIFVDQIAGSQRLVAMSAVGAAFPVHCTANGKALLACIPTDRRALLLKRGLHRLTPHTKTSPAEIEAEIGRFYDTQIAWDLEEHAEGVCAAGTAFIDPLGRDFAISVPVPTTRFAAKRAAMERLLRQAQDQAISAVPGARRPASA
jgi:DNA-binding IclR family transcriptional regulator